MADLFKQVQDYIEAHRSEMLAMWKDFVDTPSQARDREAAMKMADKLVALFQDMGLRVVEHDVGPINSRILEAYWGEDRPGTPIMFGGHYDTVNCSYVENAKPGDENEFDGTPHFRVDSQGNAHGLGCLDMKGGIVVAIWAVKALQSIGWAERPIKFLLAGDEDKGHFGAESPAMLTELAKGALCCFNMETGTTVTPTVIKGGTVPNGIPENCHIYFDVRYRRFDEAERVKKALAEIANTTYIDGTKTEYLYKEYQLPFDETPAGLALADYVAQVSREQGLGEMGQINLGGSSDACYFTMAGVPTICSMGVQGQFNHSDKEYAEVESLYRRAKLMACAVLDIEKYVNL